MQNIPEAWLSVMKNVGFQRCFEMKKRIFGIETEYGLLIKNDAEFPFDSAEVANKVKNHEPTNHSLPNPLPKTMQRFSSFLKSC